MKEFKRKFVIAFIVMVFAVCLYAATTAKPNTLTDIHEYTPTNKACYEQAVNILDELNIKEVKIKKDDSENFVANFCWSTLKKDKTNSTITVNSNETILEIKDKSATNVSEFYFACIKVLLGHTENAMSFRKDLTSGNEIRMTITTNDKRFLTFVGTSDKGKAPYKLTINYKKR